MWITRDLERVLKHFCLIHPFLLRREIDVVAGIGAVDVVIGRDAGEWWRVLRAFDDDAAGGGKAGAGEQRRVVVAVAKQLLQCLHLFFHFRVFAPLRVHRVEVHRSEAGRGERGRRVGMDELKAGGDGGAARVGAGALQGIGEQGGEVGVALIQGEGKTAAGKQPGVFAPAGGGVGDVRTGHAAQGFRQGFAAPASEVVGKVKAERRMPLLAVAEVVAVVAPVQVVVAGGVFGSIDAVHGGRRYGRFAEEVQFHRVRGLGCRRIVQSSA